MKLLQGEFKKNSQYRTALLKYTKKTKAEVKGFHAHHVFPQDFRGEFALLGIKIDDPQLMVWWEMKPHLSASPAITAAWRNWFAVTEKSLITKENAMAFGKKLAEGYGLKLNF